MTHYETKIHAILMAKYPRPLQKGRPAAVAMLTAATGRLTDPGGRMTLKVSSGDRTTRHYAGAP